MSFTPNDDDYGNQEEGLGDVLPPEDDYVPPEDDDEMSIGGVGEMERGGGLAFSSNPTLEQRLMPLSTTSVVSGSLHSQSAAHSTRNGGPPPQQHRAYFHHHSSGRPHSENFLSASATSPRDFGVGMPGERRGEEGKQQNITVIKREKGLHYAELALQRSIHINMSIMARGGGNARHTSTREDDGASSSAAFISPSPALPSQQMSLLSGIASALAGAGCSRSLLQLNRALPKQLAPQEVNPRGVTDLLTMMYAKSSQMGRGWDDESAWPASVLLQKTSAAFVTVDEKSKAQGTTAESLVERLIAIETDPPSLKGKPKVNYTHLFLFTFHLFLPIEYLFAISARMMVTCQAESGHSVSEARSLFLQKRIVGLWSWIVAMRWSDVPLDVARRIEAFCASFPLRFVISAEVEKALAGLAIACSSKRKENSSFEQNGLMSPPSSRRIVNSNILQERPPPNMRLDACPESLLDVEDVELARQFCVLSFSLFERIRLRELEHSGWTRDDLRYTTSGLISFVNFTERTTRWIAGCIVSSEDPDIRRLIYRKCVRVTRYLYDMQNYAMLSSVFQALDHVAVTRLEACKNALPKDEEEALEAIRTAMDPFSSTLKDVPHTIASPSVPLIPPYLSVMSRLEEGYKTFVGVAAEGGGGRPTVDGVVKMVNWSKLAELGTALIQFASFQSIPYPFTPISGVQRYLWVMPGIMAEDTILKVSKANEPQR